MAQQEPSLPFKVFGLQRTGTNLIQALIQKNYHVNYLTEAATGWKHGPPSPACFQSQEPARFVLCVKNPYAWLVSCYRYFQKSHRADQTMPREFCRDPQMSFDEFIHSPSYEFPSPVHRWNLMYRCWLMTLPSQYTAVVRQEDQIVDQAKVLSSLESQLQLRRRSDVLRITDRQVDVNTSVRGPMNREPYVTRAYMAEYSPSLLNHVNKLLDRDLLGLFDYSRERWALVRRRFGNREILVRGGSQDGARVSEIFEDCFGLRSIQTGAPTISRAIIVGAQTGAAVIYLRNLWPDSSISVLEPDLEQLRLLRLNTAGLAGVRFLEPADHSSDTSAEPSDLMARFDTEESVDLLWLCTPATTNALLRSTPASTARLTWIVGTAGPENHHVDDTRKALGATHAVEFRGRYFIARALSPRIPIRR